MNGSLENLRMAINDTYRKVDDLKFKFRLLYHTTDLEFERIIELSYRSPLNMVEFIENFETKWRHSKLDFYAYLKTLEQPKDA